MRKTSSPTALTSIRPPALRDHVHDSGNCPYLKGHGRSPHFLPRLDQHHPEGHITFQAPVHHLLVPLFEYTKRQGHTGVEHHIEREEGQVSRTGVGHELSLCRRV